MKHELKQLQIEKASIADDEHNEIIKTMTPQEKAKDLFDKFYLVNSESVELKTGEYDLVLSLSLDDAKQCALIAVNEVISVINPETNFKTWEFYKQVKKEIEKL